MTDQIYKGYFKDPVDLPKVTLICADCRNHGTAVAAIRHSLQHIKPARTIFFTDVKMDLPDIEVVVINRMKSTEDYSWFITKKLAQYITTSHVLVIHHDGFVLDGNAWSDDFLNYDYIGATWNYKDGRNVGNGGFSLRSKKLHTILAGDEFIEQFHPEDEIIGRLYRNYLINKYSIRIAPDEVANRFSYECNFPYVNTFGFHGNFWPPYREAVIVKRSASMGDVIMMEPLLERLHRDGYRVIIDTPLDYWNLFMNHFYKIEHVALLPHEDMRNYRVINLDMVYENQPRKLVLESYYQAAGITDGELRNPQLQFANNDNTRLFENYVVLHIDETAMAHRNIHGLDKACWDLFVAQIKNDYGVEVIQIGKGSSIIAGVKVNTFSEQILGYVVSGAKAFIGIDSGPAQVAVATGVKSLIFFGSVDPKLRYPNLENIVVVQNPCPIQKDGCYHNQISVNGTDCEVDVKHPPCITHEFRPVYKKIRELMFNVLR